MKHISILLILFLANGIKSIAQQPITKADSMRQQILAGLQFRLGLTATQFRQVDSLQQQEKARLDYLKSRTLTLEERQGYLKQIFSEQKNGMKLILSAGQWQRYVQDLEERQKGVLKAANEKGVKASQIKVE